VGILLVLDITVTLAVGVNEDGSGSNSGIVAFLLYLFTASRSTLLMDY